jgi:hypothetical protein
MDAFRGAVEALSHAFNSGAAHVQGVFLAGWEGLRRRRRIALLVLGLAIQSWSLVFLVPRLEGLGPTVVEVASTPTPIPVVEPVVDDSVLVSFQEKMDEAISTIAQGNPTRGLLVVQEVEHRLAEIPEDDQPSLLTRIGLARLMAEIGLKLQTTSREQFADQVADIQTLADRAWPMAVEREDRVWLNKLIEPVATYQDNIQGIIHLSEENTVVKELRAAGLEEPESLARMATVGSDLYLVGGGFLYLSEGITASLQIDSPITPTQILGPGDRVGGRTVTNLLDVALSSDGGSLLVLDEANRVYGYELADRRWRVEWVASGPSAASDSRIVAITSFADRLYLLDPPLNQIWRSPSDDERPANYFKEVDPKAVPDNMARVTDALDMGIDGDVYVSTEEGLIYAFTGIPPREQLGSGDTVMLPVPYGSDDPPIALQARSLYASEMEGDLYVVDADGERVVLLSKGRMKYHKQYLSQFEMVRDTQPALDKLLILAGDRLLVYPREGPFYPDAEPSDEI